MFENIKYFSSLYSYSCIEPHTIIVNKLKKKNITWPHGAHIISIIVYIVFSSYHVLNPIAKKYKFKYKISSRHFTKKKNVLAKRLSTDVNTFS